MNKWFVKICFGFLFVLAGCASSRVVSFYFEDEGQIHFKTFSFYKRDVAALNPTQVRMDSLIESTISEGLISKGYKLDYPSDAYVSFQITTGNTSSSQVSNPYYYRRTYYPYYPNDVSVTNYKEGIFLIEIYNQKDKLIWQGSKTFKERSSKDIKLILLQDAAEIIGSFKFRS